MSAETERELFRKAAEAENGMPVSAGARLSHVAAARASGRVVELDLSEVPADDRPDVLAAIQDLIGRARRPVDSSQQGASVS